MVCCKQIRCLHKTEYMIISSSQILKNIALEPVIHTGS